MKVRKIMTIAATMMVAIIFCACTKTATYRIEGTTAADDCSRTMYLKVYKDTTVLDSVAVENHRFVFEGTIDRPVMAVVKGDASRGGWLFVLENDDIALSDTVDYACGGVLNAELKAMSEALDSLESAENEAEALDSLKRLTADCWKRHNDDALGAYVTSVAIYSLGAQFVDSLYQSAGENIKNDVIYKMVSKNIEREKQTGVGQMFADAALKTLDGKAVRLSDYVGKGKYVIMDCWASWCPPCRALIPKLKELIKTGDAARKVDVIGVATRDKMEDTKKAVEELQIPWTVLVDDGLPTSIRDVYGFEGIPFVILFASDGTIVERNADEVKLKKTLGL